MVLADFLKEVKVNTMLLEQDMQLLQFLLHLEWLLHAILIMNQTEKLLPLLVMVQ